jgi:hypothetical protein
MGQSLRLGPAGHGGKGYLAAARTEGSTRRVV